MSMHDDLAAWWAALGPEERLLTIEAVRLDAPLDPPARTAPTPEQAEFVRRKPEYLERFASADLIARQSDAGLGPDPVPDAHADTVPLHDTAETEPLVFRGDDYPDDGPA